VILAQITVVLNHERPSIDYKGPNNISVKQKLGRHMVVAYQHDKCCITQQNSSNIDIMRFKILIQECAYGLLDSLVLHGNMRLTD